MDNAISMGLSTDSVRRKESRITIDLITGISFYEVDSGVSLMLQNGAAYEIGIKYDDMKAMYYENMNIVADGKETTVETIEINYNDIMEGIFKDHYKKGMTQVGFTKAIEDTVLRTLSKLT
jgi:hypothetical protein